MQIKTSRLGRNGKNNVHKQGYKDDLTTKTRQVECYTKQHIHTGYIIKSAVRMGIIIGSKH